jgi:DNA repair exonuclease SbcCD ATPase subunit
MNLVNILTRRDPLKRAFVTLEDGMTDILNEEFLLPPEPVSAGSHDGDAHLLSNLEEAAGEVDDTAHLAQVDEQTDRITPHTRSRLASHAAFDEARIRTSQELGRIGEALNAILATQNAGREFVEDCYADIHRANELEVANAAFAAENRRLTERADKLEKLRTRYDQLIDVLKRREAKLMQEAEAMREQLGILKLDAVEARNAVVRSDSQIAELQSALAARTNEAERYMRDAEMLREKNVGLALDLDLAQKRQAESRRKHEDLAAAHAADLARLSEVTARLSSEENEAARLQKLNDALESKLVEASETGAQLATELAERDRRYQSETTSLRNEVQALNGRLQVTIGDHRDSTVAANDLRSKLSDVEAEKLILEKKYAALTSELEKERRLYAAHTNFGGTKDSVVENHAAPTHVEIAALQQTASQLRMRDTGSRLRPKLDLLSESETAAAADDMADITAAEDILARRA